MDIQQSAQEVNNKRTLKMKNILAISILSAIIIVSCQKQRIPNAAVPPFIISFQLDTVPNEFVSLYYIDSATTKKIPIRISTGTKFIEADSIPTQSFYSQDLFDACSHNGLRNFKLKFYKAGVTELHDLFIDYKRLSPPGGFEIPDAAIDGKNLTPLPPSDSKGSGHYDTGFIYNR
jgi:hypothetical protein